MSRKKREKFLELGELTSVLEIPPNAIRDFVANHTIKWSGEIFKNNFPIVLELGCGFGEYTIQLAQKYPNVNFVGVDIKGARLWHGAKFVDENKLQNAFFLRTTIEYLPELFPTNSVSQLWLTFPDPQMKKVNKRLVSSRFFAIYNSFLIPNGDIHLKTDSSFLYQYTIELLKINNIPILEDFADLYNQTPIPIDNNVKEIHTKYENHWLERNIPIKYLHWQLPQQSFSEPNVFIERDSYKSYERDKNVSPHPFQ